MTVRALFFVALSTFLGFNVAGMAMAAPPKIEIIAMPHPPVRAALAPLRAWLTYLGKKVTVVEIDADSASVIGRLEKIGLRGHIPIVILIDGAYRHRLRTGRTVDLINFPDIEGRRLPYGASGPRRMSGPCWARGSNRTLASETRHRAVRLPTWSS